MYQNAVSTLKKENYSLKQKMEFKEDFQRVLELESKLKETEKRNVELQREVKSL